MDFCEWLINNKGFSTKASHDAQSRLKRVLALLGTSEVPENAVELLEKNPNFKQLSVNIKSQLRRTSRLYLEFNAQ